MAKKTLLSIAASLILVTAAVQADQEGQFKTVIGPANSDLASGADALIRGNAEDGVRLTLRGLSMAANARERVAAMSNLCAGYVMLGELERAVQYCTEALEENERHWRALSNRALAYVKLKRYDDAEADLQKAEMFAPYSKKVKTVRSMWRDAVDPVAPAIVIDDRRDADD
ncbi:MAG: hypothetical protein GWN47_03830 [Woeseiaceae bacterium]|nr:hypothetical protein [Woeseiaceae bacterium]